eukprot:TRINITY_DN59264_c0_g1_i1.p1 TRINITY_DN59264_c0_g1~~TRINITY_DN59264_c0_g1_i1.p1  ORF type:complete len:150 (+),score=9.83 TRINITY_DN59264_c0_g1_i1:37-450(+)
MKPSHHSQPPPSTNSHSSRSYSHSYSQQGYYTPPQVPPVPALPTQPVKHKSTEDKSGWPNERLRKAWGEGSESGSDVEEAYPFPQHAGNSTGRPERHFPQHVYTKWLNSWLEPIKLRVEDIYRDLRNGVLVVRFLEV